VLWRVFLIRNLRSAYRLLEKASDLERSKHRERDKLLKLLIVASCVRYLYRISKIFRLDP